MSEQLALPAPKPDKMVGKEIEKYVHPDEIPAGAKTTDEVKEQLALEAGKSPEERVKGLETALAEARTKLSDLGAKRSTSIRNKTFESTQGDYDVAHGEFTKLMQDLVRAKLEAANHSEIEKKFHGMMLLDQEWSALRNETKDKMNGTVTGKIINWLGNEDDSKTKRWAKIGVLIAGTAAATTVLSVATGGLAGGAVAGAVAGAGMRGYKGYVMRAAKGRSIHKHQNAKEYDAATNGASFEELFESGSNDGTYSEDVTSNHELNQKARKGAMIGAFGGAAVGAAFDYFDAGDKLASAWNSTFGETPTVAAVGVPGSTNQDGASFRDAEDRRWAEYKNSIDRFNYDKNENPFFAEGKPSDHAMGPALESRPELDMGIDGWNDLVQDRWVNSPEQFASVVSAMGIDGVPSDIDSADALAEHFKVTPSAHADMHAKVIDLLQQETTRVYEAPILNDYASEFGVGNEETGDVDLAWDPVVGGQRGTKIVIEFKDPNTGEMRMIELRKECGGQRIVEFYKAPVNEVPPSVWNPSTPSVTIDTTPSNPVTPHNPETPSTPTTPTEPEPPVIPPNPEPPVQPPVDDGKQGRNPGVFEDIGSGPLTDEIPVQTEETGTTGRDIGGGRTEAPHTDTVTNGQGTQQNGSAQNPNITNESQDTSANSGSGSGVGQGDTSGGTTSTDNGASR